MGVAELFDPSLLAIIYAKFFKIQILFVEKMAFSEHLL